MLRKSTGFFTQSGATRFMLRLVIQLNKFDDENRTNLIEDLPKFRHKGLHFLFL